MPKKLSIITVCFRAKDSLPSTFESVAEQSLPEAMEYLVVDGASDDGTLELIEANKERIHAYVSEPDKGIYDAMNKGLDMASGDYILFLNAGDRLAHPKVVEQLLPWMEQDMDLLYSDCWIVDSEGNPLGLRSALGTQSIGPGLTWKDFKYGMRICHQCFIPKRSLCPRYDEHWKISADIDWEIQIMKKARSLHYLEEPIAKFLHGGASHKQLNRAWKERYQVLGKHFGWGPNLVHHAYIGLRAIALILKKGGRYW